jgi:protein involved in polysaccharide export with SLBB domain
MLPQLGAALLVCAVLGCAASPSGGRLSLFPQGNRLTADAKAIRASTPPPAAIPRELDKQVSGPYVVEPGDVLLVQPSSLDSPIRLPGDQPILPDGTIQLGRYGHYLAAGKTIDVIQREVNAFLEKELKDGGPLVVRLISRESKVFYVLGEVNAPGAFPLRGREAVLDAILAAGGLNSSANRDKIILSRPTAPDSCRVVLPVRYNDIVQLGDTTTNYQIRAGDRVYVPNTTLCDDLKRMMHKDKECSGPQFGCPAPIDHHGPKVKPVIEVVPATPAQGKPVEVTPVLPAPETPALTPAVKGD